MVRNNIFNIKRIEVNGGKVSFKNGPYLLYQCLVNFYKMQENRLMQEVGTKLHIYRIEL